MSQPNKTLLSGPRNQTIGESDAHTMLELLLALDRALVELSMHMYNLPVGDRFVMREQNQRLHDAVREHLPRRPAATSRCTGNR